MLEVGDDNNPYYCDLICVIGYRKPTIKEAAEFWKDILYDNEKIIKIHRISKEYANENFVNPFNQKKTFK